MASPPPVAVVGAPAPTRRDDERVSAERRRELAEDFSRLVAERRAAVTRTDAAGRAAAPADGATATRRAAQAPIPNGMAAAAERGASDGGAGTSREPSGGAPRTVARSGGVGENGLARPEGGSAGGDPAARSPAVPSTRAETRAEGQASGAEDPVGAVRKERLTDVQGERTEAPGEASEPADEPSPRVDERDEERVDDGAARDALAAASGAAAGTVSGAVAERAPTGADRDGGAPSGAAAERIAAAAEAMGALLADTDRFADVPEEGRWRFTLLDGDDDALGFVVTRDADGTRSVALDGGEHHAPLLEALRHRLAALDVDVSVDGAPP